eukprot:CAMPEP_0119540936 /NCGR_PEP_ID=MMETSP1344-20130328/52662_1 /TAXON_ID=236787 /ORGANISM="Florenciella parvula, Strain CCMP2471" /LENGTH=43 /DNA_ID= /DNA_START= /DNA_END= /DNA_ORIENTATION=
MRMAQDDDEPAAAHRFDEVGQLLDIVGQQVAVGVAISRVQRPH